MPSNYDLIASYLITLAIVLYGLYALFSTVGLLD